jgi:hypothetical protein
MSNAYYIDLARLPSIKASVNLAVQTLSLEGTRRVLFAVLLLVRTCPFQYNSLLLSHMFRVQILAN